MTAWLRIGAAAQAGQARARFRGTTRSEHLRRPRQRRGQLEIVLRPDPSIWDGQFANNGWLQELPKPLTKLTWDNAALVSLCDRTELGRDERRCGETAPAQAARFRRPIWITPGHADDSVTLHLGYGRRRAGNVGTGIGFNAYAIRSSSAPWIGTGSRSRRPATRTSW